MLFSSTTFLYLFLPAALLGNYLLFRWNRTAQNVFLLAISLLFYAWGEPSFVLVMIASIMVNWGFGLVIAGRRERGKPARMLLAADVTLNLALLFVFKYLTFTGITLNRFLGTDWAVPAIALPIGISFFTFQAMSYVIDVYRGKGGVQKNILFVGLYISFFPQLIAGPIVRYETIAEEIMNRRETLGDAADGFARFVVGLGKKVLLANSFAILADRAFDASAGGVMLSVGFSWLGAIAYAMQILFDFSGYSDMAIGLGRMFGFHFPENFRDPYIASSVTDFWRRWHISLSTWFRDYVYIPLGGNRGSKARNILNLFLVWLLTGAWHGANFTFIAWGLMYFVLLVAERGMGGNREKRGMRKLIGWIYTMLFVLLGWVLFRSESLGAALVYLKTMFGLNGNPLSDGLFRGYLMQNLVLLIAGVVGCTPLLRTLGSRMKGNAVLSLLKTLGLMAVLALSVAAIVSSSYNPFIYFHF